MVTEVVKTVGLGGSRNFTTLVNWDIARRGNLTTGGVDGIPGGVTTPRNITISPIVNVGS